MTETDLRHWLATANCGAVCEYVVARVAAETEHGHELALEWIDAADENAASAGWATLGSLVSVTDDADLDLDELKGLLARVQGVDPRQPDRVRYAMNGFVIAAGSYVKGADRPGHPDRKGDRPGRGGHGGDGVQGAVRPGLHPDGQGPGATVGKKRTVGPVLTG